MLMTSYRWTRHRVVDGHANDRMGLAAISMWRVARAAAEETLQGAPLAPAWLKLFRGQLSTRERYWLRWQGDLGESAELRRAYSGLYGRFFARAMLAHHLGLTRFLSLKRNGLAVPGSVDVRRTSNGDIPDWIAWDDANAQFVLCEAKGSLSASDFLAPGMPKCVSQGKAQFRRVETFDAGRRIHPNEWVAATRWSTDRRNTAPATLLWDPPVRSEPFTPEDADRHRAAMSAAWLESIAAGLGARNGSDLLSAERRKTAVVIRADCGPTPDEDDWPETEPDEDEWLFDKAPNVDADTVPSTDGTFPGHSDPESTASFVRGAMLDQLTASPVYPDRTKLDAPTGESSPLEGAFVAATITRFGIRPVRSATDFDALRRDQDAALERVEPAMLIGIPADFDANMSKDPKTWLDGAGISSTNGIALFDLRRVSIDRSS